MLDVNDSPLNWEQLSSKSFVDNVSSSKPSYGTVLGSDKISLEKRGNNEIGKSLSAIEGDASVSNSR